MLKKLLFIIVFSLFAQVSHALEDNMRVGAEYAYYRYREPSVNPNGPLMRGAMYGINFSYSYDYNDYFLDLEGRFLAGKGKYDGFLMNGTPSQSSHMARIFEARILPGVKMNTFDWYTGLGYRFKGDDRGNIRQNNIIVLGYRRKAQYLYIPLGMRVLSYEDVYKDMCLSIRPYLEYDLFIKGVTTSAVNNQTKLHLKQTNGFGTKLGVVFRIDQFEITPYLNYWNIETSKIDAGFIEPRNTTTELGLKLAYVF